MIKLVALLKRKSGMSMEDFIDYYENRHAKIGEKYVSKHAVRYIRRYLRPLPGAADTDPEEQYYDVVTETWFPDQRALEAAFRDLGAEEVRAEIARDEEKLFDLSRIHFYLVEEYESDLGK